MNGATPSGPSKSIPTTEMAITIPCKTAGKVENRFQNRSNLPTVHVCINNPIKRTATIPQFIDGAEVQLLPKAANTSNARSMSTDRKNTHPAHTKWKVNNPLKNLRKGF